MRRVWSEQTIAWHVLALFLYAGLAIWLTWPLAAQFGDALAGSSTDAHMHFWNGWWVRHALQNGQSPFFTTHIFYPDGASLVYHNFAWLSIVPWLALQTVLDELIAYNLVFLANLVFCGYAAFLLARSLTDDMLAAFLAGVIYLAWPYRIAQLDHPNLISTGWIPIFMLFLVKTVRGGQWRHALFAGLALALVGYTRWQLLIPAAVVAGVYLLAVLPSWARQRQRWLALLALAGVTALLLAPPAALLLRQQLGTPDTAGNLLRDSEEAVMQTDLLAYVTPPPDQPLLRQQTEAAYDRYYPDRTRLRRFTTYLGLTTLALAAVGVWRRRRDALPWLLIALALMLLALGPVLRLNGQLYAGVPTPYRVLEPLFLFRLIRVPERFNMVLALPLAMLAAYGAAELLARLRRRQGARPWQPVAATAGLSLLVLFEYAAGPAPLQRTAVSPYFAEMAAAPGEFAVLSLPIDPLQAKDQMFAQTTHTRPILNGKTARLPQGAYSFIDGHPLLRVLRQSSEMDPWLTDVGGQLASLQQEGIERIIFHKDQIGADRIERWRRYLSLAPLFEDERIAVFRTDPQAGRDFALGETLAPGVGPVRTLITGDCFQPGQPLEVDVLWGSAGPVAPGQEVRLALRDGAGDAVQSETYPLPDGGDGAGWPANSLVWGYYPLQIDDDVPAGDYTVTASLAGADADATVVLGEVAVAAQACPGPLPEAAAAVDALFGRNMRLLGYDLEQPADGRLVVTLYWRGEQRTPTDYKVFVHVFPATSGVPVAQDDAMPHRGGFPTRFWAPGDVVVDHIPIQLADVPAGEYGLAVGVYDPVSLERLPVTPLRGPAPEDDRLILVAPGGIVVP